MEADGDSGKYPRSYKRGGFLNGLIVSDSRGSPTRETETLNEWKWKVNTFGLVVQEKTALINETVLSHLTGRLLTLLGWLLSLN